MFKTKFTEEESHGLTPEELRVAKQYLKKNKTAGALNDLDAAKIYELFLLGCSFAEIHKEFPQFSLGRIILTAALRKWGLERDKLQHTLKDRIKAKVIRSVVDQVDFLTTMLAATNAEHMEQMRKYVLDPKNNPAPDFKIKSIKDYKEVADSLYKIVQGTNPGSNKTSPLLDAFNSPPKAITNNNKHDSDDEDMDEDDDIDITSVVMDE